MNLYEKTDQLLAYTKMMKAHWETRIITLLVMSESEEVELSNLSHRHALIT
jgi:hypothetical protein